MTRFQRHLVIMAREPRLGRVKRRLARDIGDVAAWRFYRTHLAALLRRLGRDPRWRTWLALTPDGASAKGLCTPPGVAVLPQGGGDLGARMERTLRVLPPGPAAILGSDIPGVEPRHIEAAFEGLGAHSWVFGPAADGGYWLVGACRRPRLDRAFAGVRWSSPHALGDTLRNLRGSRVAFLEELRDVDCRADLESLTHSRNAGYGIHASLTSPLRPPPHARAGVA